MKKKDWNEGLNHIDEELVEEFVSKSEEIERKKRNKSIWLRVVAIASSFAIIVGAIIAIPMKPTNEIPTWDEPMYSAEEIASIFNTNVFESVGMTNQYKQVLVYNGHSLSIDAVPNDKYLGVYKYQSELWQFGNRFLPKLMKELDLEPIDNYDISREDSDYIEYEFDARHIRVSKYDDGFGAQIILYSNDAFFDPMSGWIDSSLSDQEINRLLEPIKKKLFDIFDVSFSGVNINRDNGRIRVRFYNKSVDYPDQTQLLLYPEYISLNFYGARVYINYVDSDYTAKEYSRIANAKKISLEAAEELLYKGYVFCFHTCSYCMRDQEAISFEGYDYVGLEYVFERIGKSRYNEELGIPFYTFYKKLEVREDGTTVYAKTYVPAIELSGYEEYFETIAREYHENS